MAEVLGNMDVKRIEVEENLVVDFQFLLQEIMNKRGISRADLARMTGLSKARISQIMRDDANPQLRTMANLFFALGEEVQLDVKGRTKAHVVEEQRADLNDMPHARGWHALPVSGESKPQRVHKDTRAKSFERERNCARIFREMMIPVEDVADIHSASNDNPGYEFLLEYATA